MSWGFVAVAAGATLVTGALGADAAKDASRAQGRAGDAAIDEQRRQFDISTQEQRRQLDTLLQLTANQRSIGNQALNALGASFGYSPAPGYAPQGDTTYADPVTQQLGQRWDQYSRQDLIDQYNESNPEQLVGDTYLPAGTTTKHVGKGWYEVHYGGQRIGTLRPGGANGRFINDTGFDVEGAKQAAQQQWLGSRTNVSTPTTPTTGINSLMVQPDGSVRIGSGSPLATTSGSAQSSPIPETSPLSRPPASPLDPNAFTASPDYAFRRSEGMKGIEGSFAARGGAQSGNALRALNEFNSNLAAGEYGNWFQRQQSEYDRWFNRNAVLAGIGQTATNQAGSGAIQTGSGISGDAMRTGANVGNALIAGGDARASGITGSANAWGNALQDLSGLYGYWMNRPTTSPTSSGWSGPR